MPGFANFWVALGDGFLLSSFALVVFFVPVCLVLPISGDFDFGPYLKRPFRL